MLNLDYLDNIKLSNQLYGYNKECKVFKINEDLYSITKEFNYFYLCRLAEKCIKPLILFKIYNSDKTFYRWVTKDKFIAISNNEEELKNYLKKIKLLQ